MMIRLNTNYCDLKPKALTILFLFTSFLAFGIVVFVFNQSFATITIDDHFKHSKKIGERFLSIGLDTYNIYYGLYKLNLNSTKLIDLTSKLSPGFLRFGGTMADRLIFEDENLTKELNQKGVICQDEKCAENFLPFFTMNGSDFLQVVDFCRKTNMRLIFDLNALLRNGDDWNPKNAIRLLEFAKEHNVDIDWQLGNEPNSFEHVFNVTVPPKQLGRDFKVLRDLLQEYFPNSLLVGPDSTRPQPNRPECVKYMKEFLDEASNVVDAMAWHQYYLNGRIATLDDFWDPNTMYLLQSQIDTMINHTREYQNHLDMWLTETSSAYGGGAPNLSNSFASIPLWLDKLGIASKNGIQVVARQSLLKGNYSLLDENHNPLPDYWVSVLFKNLVGNKVVNCTVESSPYQRFYCLCSKKNNYIIFGMNLEDNTCYISFIGSLFQYVSQIDQYILTAPDGDRLSKGILLNDVLLKYDGNFPKMTPKILISKVQKTLPPYSFGFWEIYSNDRTQNYCSP